MSLNEAKNLGCYADLAGVTAPSSHPLWKSSLLSAKAFALAASILSKLCINKLR